MSRAARLSVLLHEIEVGDTDSAMFLSRLVSLYGGDFVALATEDRLEAAGLDPGDIKRLLDIRKASKNPAAPTGTQGLYGPYPKAATMALRSESLLEVLLELDNTG